VPYPVEAASGLGWPADIADIACGIGTQLIGLAGLGHRLLGSDTSLRAVQRARRECAAAGVDAALLVADMRRLPWGDPRRRCA